MTFRPLRATTAVLFVLTAAHTSAAQSIQGTATYWELMAWPPTAVFEAVLQDVSRADVAAEVIARTRIVNPPNSPIRFEIPYDDARIQFNHTYAVRAYILVDGRMMFTTDSSYAVLTRGNGNVVSMTMRRIGDVRPAAPEPSQNADPLLGLLPATFAGTLPCADCPGIHYQLNVFPDQVFFLRMTYRDRNVSLDDIGRWFISSDGRILLLQGNRSGSHMFAIARPDALRLLDADGQAIASSLNYDLQRTPGLVPIEPALIVRGMYRYMADAGIFTECLTGRRLAVAQERDNAALESAYATARREAGDELMMLLEGRLVLRPNPDTGVQQPALVVERFIRVAPDSACAAQYTTRPLELTRWRATLLGGKPVPSGDPNRVAVLVFEPGGRVSGSDGCNRLSGSYEVNGDAILFGQMATTRMACPDTSQIERAFHDALRGAREWRILGIRLELLDASGARLARFEAD